MIILLVLLGIAQAAQFIYFYKKIQNKTVDIQEPVQQNRSVFSILYGNK